jgi:hypothetical protein
MNSTPSSLGGSLRLPYTASMKAFLISIVLLLSAHVFGQSSVDFSRFNKKGAAKASLEDGLLAVTWPAGEGRSAKLLLKTSGEGPLIESMQLGRADRWTEVARRMQPVFILTEGKRDLEKRGGWNIFFDVTAYKPHTSHLLRLEPTGARIISEGSRTIVQISGMEGGNFRGDLELTLFNGSPLMNIAAVMSTRKDSTAIIYDAAAVQPGTRSENLAVKYRAISGETADGSIAVFPPPHQYFYPLDNAYNLRYTWYGTNYRNLIGEFALGIRQDLMGDNRHVPWFNAPPETQQRLNFFVLLSDEKDGKVLGEVKRFTNSDTYKPLKGYYTMASHFHTEHIDDILTHKPLPEIPGHVKALRGIGVNIMHLGEFHLAGNPGDPGPRRLPEFHKMFEESKRLSSGDFLMLPGEEPNSHFGGHWMNIFPKPVYWIMSRDKNQPFVEDHPEYGKVYRVGNKEEMLKLLELEKGLAWTAHARIKGSTGYPDRYKDEAFFKSDRFLGAAWKPMPADLSEERLGKRVLDVMDDMANWGQKKYVIGEADLFKIEPSYELYANMNINYLQLDKLPKFEEGWQPVLDAMEQGKFFVSTGEVLIPRFSVNGKGSGETLQLSGGKKAAVSLTLDWTFPLAYAEIISGDGEQVYRERIDLTFTEAFGNQEFNFNTDLSGRKWVRVEIWDAAVNGAFTQCVWLE